jgi:hypothetical protein
MTYEFPLFLKFTFPLKLPFETSLTLNSLPFVQKLFPSRVTKTSAFKALPFQFFDLLSLVTTEKSADLVKTKSPNKFKISALYP